MYGISKLAPARKHQHHISVAEMASAANNNQREITEMMEK